MDLGYERQDMPGDGSNGCGDTGKKKRKKKRKKKVNIIVELFQF